MSSLSRPGERSSVDHDPVPVTLERLDETLSGGVNRIAFIKLDVEGHELAVLQGSVRSLRAFHPTILVEIEQRHQEADISETFAYLENLGYRGSFVAPDGLRPLAEFDVQRHQLDLLPQSFTVGRPAPGYVSDFLFVAAQNQDDDSRSA